MTQIAVQAQIDIIDKATKQAIKTKESAIKFLVDAGIMEQPNIKKSKTNLTKVNS